MRLRKPDYSKSFLKNEEEQAIFRLFNKPKIEKVKINSKGKVRS